MSKQAFIPNFLNLVKFSLGSKNECVALTAFKLSAVSNTPGDGGHDLSASLIQMDNAADFCS